MDKYWGPDKEAMLKMLACVGVFFGCFISFVIWRVRKDLKKDGYL